MNNYNRSMSANPPLDLSSHHNSQLVIPLISKRLNNVEKYINEFPAKAEELNRVGESRRHTQNRGTSDRHQLHHYMSAQLSPFLQQDEQPNDRCCLKYNSILAQKSEERIQSLSRLEKDYKLLKERMHPDRRSPKAAFSVGKHKNETSIIAQEDVQRQLKSSVINENGKKYFADLYLLKKGREQIMSSLSNAGRAWVQQRSYEQKVRSSEHEFVKNKILQQREVKRTKMLRGRNLHWNVYYDMLALSNNEKKKLKGICKFTETFGIL